MNRRINVFIILIYNIFNFKFLYICFRTKYFNSIAYTKFISLFNYSFFSIFIMATGSPETDRV